MVSENNFVDALTSRIETLLEGVTESDVLNEHITGFVRCHTQDASVLWVQI